MNTHSTGLRGSIQPFFRSMAIAASGLSAQRIRIDAIAANIANAETTRAADGMPYRRRVVELREVRYADLAAQAGPRPRLHADLPQVAGSRPRLPERDSDAGGVEVVGVAEDLTPGPLIYDPGHPHANELGYVERPNVRITEEMVDLMEARRLYEANATVFEAVKAMLRRATQL